MVEIPLFIFHLGNQEYFKKCIEINSKFNKIYLIGDQSNKELANKNVIHYDINNFNTTNINNFKNCFTNYSSNPFNYELNCYLRIFYLKELMKLTNIYNFFHLDSDCILIEKIKNIQFNTDICYSLQGLSQKRNKFHMVGCIHNGLINNVFCDTFINLCFDIYGNKTKFNLIEPKIRWHKENNIPGGICDMTLYYLLHSEKLIEVTDLNNIINVNNEECVFDHNITSPYGYMGENTYKIMNGIKELVMHNNKYYVKTEDNKNIRLLSLHFQGNAKQILQQLNASQFT